MATSKPGEHGGNVQRVSAMRERLQKWCKRLLWVLPAVLALYVFLKVADFVWFRTQIPVGFVNANWSGKWETQRYWRLSGNLLVRLPDPLPENQDFKAEALVYYPIYSTWKTGQFLKMDFQGFFNPDSPTSAGRSTNTLPGGGGKLKFKGIVGNQVVEYVAIIDESRTRIVGGYLSASPYYDVGFFHITNP
jgi:hypothetical protein